MPYIPEKDKMQYDVEIQILAQRLVPNLIRGKNWGHLNYVISKLLIELFNENTGLHPNYDTLSSAAKELDRAKTEFDRCAIAPYEDKKAIENGDIYESLRLRLQH